MVCAVTGEPGAWYVRADAYKEPSPALFLLLLLGPIGWLVLAMALARRQGTFVEIPISQQVYDDLRERRRRARWLAGVSIAELGAAVFLASGGLDHAAWLVFLPAIFVAVWVGSVKNHRIRLSIDGVGLVTIKKAHPNFASAVASWRRDAPIGIAPR
jgi:hypothetical protein